MHLQLFNIIPKDKTTFLFRCQVKFCFFYDEHFWCRVSRIPLQHFQKYFFYSVFYRFSSTAYNETHSNQGHLTKFSTSLTGKKSWNLSKNYPSHHAIHYKPGAHQQKPAITPYSCHGVFTDRSIFSVNLSRIQIPTGTSVTNCNHEHGLVDMSK